MPEILDHVAYLSQQIGPRPAGTEEEQQAALYITELMQKEAGLSAVIEDFNGAGNADIPRAICCAATLIVAALSLFLPVLAIPAIIVAVIALVQRLSTGRSSLRPLSAASAKTLWPSTSPAIRPMRAVRAAVR